MSAWAAARTAPRGSSTASTASYRGPAGLVYAEGDPATRFYVLLDGTMVLSRRVGGDDIEAGRTSQRGVYAGAWQAYLGDRVPQRYPSSMRVTVRGSHHQRITWPNSPCPAPPAGYHGAGWPIFTDPAAGMN